MSSILLLRADLLVRRYDCGLHLRSFATDQALNQLVHRQASVLTRLAVYIQYYNAGNASWILNYLPPSIVLQCVSTCHSCFRCPFPILKDYTDHQQTSLTPHLRRSYLTLIACTLTPFQALSLTMIIVDTGIRVLSWVLSANLSLPPSFSFSVESRLMWFGSQISKVFMLASLCRV